jgi:hypothetical protein
MGGEWPKGGQNGHPSRASRTFSLPAAQPLADSHHRDSLFLFSRLNYLASRLLSIILLVFVVQKSGIKLTQIRELDSGV